MFVKKMMICSLGLAMSLHLVACSGTPGLLPGPKPGTTANGPSYKGLQFGPIKPEHANFANQGSTPTSGSATPAAAPSADASKMMISPERYFGSAPPGEEYVLENVSEATMAGYSGTFKESISQVVSPIVKEWSSDARLIDSGGTTGGDGKALTADIPQYASSYDRSWRYTYTSAQLKETLLFYVSAKETLVIKNRWVLKNLDASQVAYDSNQVLDAVKKAIMDKNFKPKDDPSNTGVPVAEYGGGQKVEVLYEVPENATWSLYLYQDRGKLVWSVNMNIWHLDANSGGTTGSSGGGVAYATPAVAPAPAMRTMAVDENGNPLVDPPSDGAAITATPDARPMPVNTWTNGAYATVDAKTGEILTLSRPMRFTQDYSTSYPMPMPAPAETKPAPEVQPM